MEGYKKTERAKKWRLRGGGGWQGGAAAVAIRLILFPPPGSSFLSKSSRALMRFCQDREKRSRKRKKGKPIRRDETIPDSSPEKVGWCCCSREYRPGMSREQIYASPWQR
ncbi:hypothetical protein CEXT_247701 [Caerostris extrusa]|uniref:Uncharacterized protein n=1 Tax=Caerostris extrusa TaxID=172846 RepID=A0AAV4MNV5_CAEEX|nr:hypothetical protein CEXT_247701 [Caerostris extrusa]